MYIQGSPEFEHHVKTYGPHKDFGYKDFIPMFRAEKFDAAKWADLFEKAGARYVVPVGLSITTAFRCTGVISPTGTPMNRGRSGIRWASCVSNSPKEE